MAEKLWLDQTVPTIEPGRAWHQLMKNAWLRRFEEETFSQDLHKVAEQHPAASADIAHILVGFRCRHNGFDDRLIFLFAAVMLEHGCLHAGDLLLALLRRSRYGNTPECRTFDERRINMRLCEDKMFGVILGSAFPSSAQQGLELVFGVFRWLRVVGDHEMGKQLADGNLYAFDPALYATYEKLANLAITVLSHPAMRSLKKNKWWKERRTKMIEALETYDVHVLQVMGSQLAGRVRGLTNTFAFIEFDKRGLPILTDEQIHNMVPEVPMTASRAGVFIWLSAALSARPLTDDVTILSYLQARYPGDAQSQMINLLVGSFDLLTNVIIRKESSQHIKAIRSFICNKVPGLLTMLNTILHPPATAEACIQMAFNHLITMDPLPPITAGANTTREALKSTRLDFLQSCALHGLANEHTISALLQQQVALPRVARYNKDTLVAQCANNLNRLEHLVDELEGLQGNAGAIAACIVQTVNNFCMNKDTMSLKTVCNELTKRLPSMDIVLQYTAPVMILAPLCTLLDEWIHDQDQTECTPAFEEYSSILLFTLSVIDRYELESSEIGVSSENFVFRLLDNITSSKLPGELSEEQSSQLSNWIEGLYAVDEAGETNGIGDEVMRQCSPQSFYLLVPTLFEQSVLACKSNALPMTTFKVGLELLLEPFLLPSLIIGLRWLAQHSWEEHDDMDILLQIFERLLKPASSSQDAQIMHRAVLTMVANPVHASLQDLLSKRPDKKKAAELMEILKPYLNRQRKCRLSGSDLENMTNADPLSPSYITHAIRSLIVWAAISADAPNPPPSFSFLAYAVVSQQVSGEDLMQGVLTELRTISDLDDLARLNIAYDICVALMCPPTAVLLGMPPSRLAANVTKLRDTVRLTASNLQALMQRPAQDAQNLIRLTRRIDAHLHAIEMPPTAMPIAIPEIAIPDQAADQIMMQDLAGSIVQSGDLAGLEQQLDLANPTAQDIAQMAADPSAMDIGSQQLFDTMDLGMGQVDPANPPADLQAQEEDIFAELDGLDMGDLGEEFNF